jgi:hypothetical protein
VRALDHRLRVKLEARDSVRKQLEAQIADMTRQGLTLTRPFYLLLEDYVKSGKRFDELCRCYSTRCQRVDLEIVLERLTAEKWLAAGRDRGALN